MITAIVQARMASTRLPGKVLKKIMGRPLLSYQIERLREVGKIEKIIIATTTNREDDQIVQLCKSESILCFMGSDEDVLDRYYQAAKKYQIGHIMRITADCPLIDPQLCNHIARIYLESNADFIHTGSTFAEGVDCEILSFKALGKAWNESTLKSEREHVTLYLHNHPELFKKITFHNKTDDSKYRFTIDEPEDFEVVKAIIEALYNNLRLFSINDIKGFLDSNPDVFKKNSHIIRNEGLLKSLKADY